MTEIINLHEEAMSFFDQAFFAKRNGDKKGAKKFLLRALDLETKAADKLVHDFSAEPSRSVLYRSAASIAIQCKKRRQARRLLKTALIGNPPAEIVREIRELEELTYGYFSYWIGDFFFLSLLIAIIFLSQYDILLSYENFTTRAIINIVEVGLACRLVLSFSIRGLRSEILEKRKTNKK